MKRRGANIKLNQTGSSFRPSFHGPIHGRMKTEVFRPGAYMLICGQMKGRAERVQLNTRSEQPARRFALNLRPDARRGTRITFPAASMEARIVLPTSARSRSAVG